MESVVEQVTFPAKVFRGAGALAKLNKLCKSIGGSAFVFGGKTALEKTQTQIGDSLKAAGVTVKNISWYGGECSRRNIDALVKAVRTSGAAVIIAVGGGKALDTGKMVSCELKLPLITVPTIAATCAAITPVSVVYSDQGAFVEMVCFDECPAGTVIDTDVILHSPLRWLAAGMGDTLAKWYEYRVSIKSAQQTGLTLAAVANGKLCYDMIERFGGDARIAMEEGTFGEALDTVVDAIILYAGTASILGGEKIRSAAAHGFHNGLTIMPAAHQIGHGAIVGYGNLCLLALENRSDEELVEAIRLAKRCAVPTMLNELIALTDDELRQVAAATMLTPDMVNMPFRVTEEMIIAATHRVDALSQGLMD